MIHAYFASEDDARQMAADLNLPEWVGANVNGYMVIAIPNAKGILRDHLLAHPKTKGVLPNLHSPASADTHAVALKTKKQKGTTTYDILSELYAAVPLWFLNPDG